MSFIEDNQIKAVCFDIDGTLYPKWKMDVRLFKSSFFDPVFALKYNKMRKEIRKEDGYGLLDILSEDEIKRRNASILYGDSSRDSVERFIKKEKRLRENWDREYRNIKSAKGLSEALDKLKDNGLRLAAFSDFPIGVKLKAMGIEGYFEFALSSEEIGHFKPSRTPFSIISSSFGLDESKILYVGDSYRKDVVGSKLSGMHSCLIFRKNKKSYNKADIVAKDWKDFISKVL